MGLFRKSSGQEVDLVRLRQRVWRECEIKCACGTEYTIGQVCQEAQQMSGMCPGCWATNTGFIVAK